MRIAIAGTGYVGIVTAGVLAEVGHTIICVDIDKDKIEKLKEGICPIFEPGLPELLANNKSNLNYTTEYKKAYEEADVIIIAVGTPEKSDGYANLKYVYSVAKQIAQSVKRETVVVIKSTVPIGTHDKVKTLLDEETKGKSYDIDIVSNPEFLSQGTAVKDMQKPNRIVIGAETNRAKDIMERVYEKFDCPKVYTDCKSAEMIKYASNDFLALKVSYINEIANVCELVGANIEDVAQGMGYDPRIGSMFLKAGIGYGGSCFPKDTKALHWLAGMYDYEIKTIKASIEVNKEQKIKLVKKLRKEAGDLRGKKIAVLGLAFKPGTDDIRESAALDCIPLLADDGVNIFAWDPCAAENFKRKVNSEDYNLFYCNSIDEAVIGADACLIITNWPEIVCYDLQKYVELMKDPLIIDGRNCYCLEKAKESGIKYISIGRKEIKP
jgi:UDPglucose 6-dehydrogenase